MSKTITRTAAVAGGSKASDEWRTEPACFDALHAEFGFRVDLAANRTDHLCETWLGPGGIWHDALGWDWHKMTGPGFFNPPYSAGRVAPFVTKAIAEVARGFTSVALLPDTHDTVWYRLLDAAAEIRRIPHRVKYLKPDGATAAGAMFPSCVAVFRPQPGVRDPRPRIVTWTYR